MARRNSSTLTGADVYILLCLREECCGMDVMGARERADGRARPFHSTLYNLLERQFLAAGYIVETRGGAAA